MGPEVIIFPAPLFNYYLGFDQRHEYLSIKQFVPQLTVKGFDITVLPWTTGFNVQDSEEGGIKSDEVADLINKVFKN